MASLREFTIEELAPLAQGLKRVASDASKAVAEDKKRLEQGRGPRAAADLNGAFVLDKALGQADAAKHWVLTKREREALDLVVSYVERRGKAPRGGVLTSKFMDGDWELVYTTDRSLSGVAVTQSMDGAARVRKKEMVVRKESSVLGLRSAQTVRATYEHVGPDGIRVVKEQLVAEGMADKGGGLPVPMIGRQPVTRVTYLDKRWRVMRQDGGGAVSVFRRAGKR